MSKFITRECIADIAGVFEDFIEKQGWELNKPFDDMDERKSTEAAILYGEDYDYILREIENVFIYYGYKCSDMFGIKTLKEWHEELKRRGE